MEPDQDMWISQMFQKPGFVINDTKRTKHHNQNRNRPRYFTGPVTQLRQALVKRSKSQEGRDKSKYVAKVGVRGGVNRTSKIENPRKPRSKTINQRRIVRRSAGGSRSVNPTKYEAPKLDLLKSFNVALKGAGQALLQVPSSIPIQLPLPNDDGSSSQSNPTSEDEDQDDKSSLYDFEDIVLEKVVNIGDREVTYLGHSENVEDQKFCLRISEYKESDVEDTEGLN